MLKWLKSLVSKAPEQTASTPADTCIYAVGDIHGRLDLLTDLQQKILDDSQKRTASRKVLIYMGDYIDRGLNSKQVIEQLVTAPLKGFDTVYLKGNHEDALLRFLETPEESAAWLLWGGDATLRSYGVEMHNAKGKRFSPTDMSQSLAELLPETHKQFLNRLTLHHQEGDYVFVHAGLRPGKELAEQNPEDLMMIREPFIFSRQKFPYTVVFGHTIFSEPFIEKDRIGIDTGAYASGKLTCAVFEGTEQSFLYT